MQNLLRNKESGIYYGRFTLAGKQKWYSLDTTVLSAAKRGLRVRADEVGKLARELGVLRAEPLQ